MYRAVLVAVVLFLSSQVVYADDTNTHDILPAGPVEISGFSGLWNIILGGVAPIVVNQQTGALYYLNVSSSGPYGFTHFQSNGTPLVITVPPGAVHVPTTPIHINLWSPGQSLPESNTGSTNINTVENQSGTSNEPRDPIDIHGTK